jgi:6,7-dimethyl-8-ribityllumazine synthase
MQPTVPTVPSPAQDLRVAVIAASWHAEIVGRASTSFVDAMAQQHWPASRIAHFQVPGAFEIPLLAQQLARSGRFAAIVACALVVDGGIYRHDFVAGAVIDGLMRVQLDTGVPVLSVVLTPQAFHAHDEHQRFFAEHFVLKGAEAARACLQLLSPAYRQALATV